MNEEQGYIPEHSELVREGLKKGEWVEVTTDSPVGLAVSLEDAVREAVKAKGYKLELPGAGEMASQAVTRTFKNIFKHGLKDESILEKGEGFKFRLVDTPARVLKKEGLVMTVAYELEVNLAPKYSQDGQNGNYALRFIIYATQLSEKQLKQRPLNDQNRVVVRTSQNEKANRRVERRIDKRRINNWRFFASIENRLEKNIPMDIGIFLF